MIQLSRRTAFIGVCACIVLAALLRFYALGANLPCELEPDGTILAGQVALIQEDAPDRDSGTVWRLYPHLVSEIAALIPARVLKDGTLEDHLAQASSIFVRVRFVSALLSLLLIPATYWLARRFLARGASLLAAFLSAVSLLTLLFAQQARPHAPAAAFALLAVVAALRLARKPNWLNCSLAAVALGLAIGTLQSGLAAALPVAAAWSFRDRKAVGSANRWWAPAWIVAVVGSIAFVLYPNAAPERASGPAEATGFMGLTLNSGGATSGMPGGVSHAIHLDMLDGSGFATVARSLISFETLPLIAALIGIAIWLRSMLRGGVRAPIRREQLVVAAYVLPYLLVLGLYGKTYERFCLQLLPFVACLAAAMWADVALLVSRRVAIALLLVLALPQLGACLSLQQLRSRQSGSTQLAHWIEKHVAPQTERVLLVPSVDVPLARTAEAIKLDAGAAFGTPWTLYQRMHAKERWDCPRFELTYSPLLRREDVLAAIDSPHEVLRSTPAAYLALLVPSIDRSHTIATRLNEAFQLELFGKTSPVFQAPIESEDGLTQPIIGEEMKIRLTIWTWTLLVGTPTIGPTYQIYRLP